MSIESKFKELCEANRGHIFDDIPDSITRVKRTKEKFFEQVSIKVSITVKYFAQVVYGVDEDHEVAIFKVFNADGSIVAWFARDDNIPRFMSSTLRHNVSDLCIRSRSMAKHAWVQFDEEDDDDSAFGSQVFPYWRDVHRMYLSIGDEKLMFQMTSRWEECKNESTLHTSVAETLSLGVHKHTISVAETKTHTTLVKSQSANTDHSTMPYLQPQHTRSQSNNESYVSCAHQAITLQQSPCSVSSLMESLAKVSASLSEMVATSSSWISFSFTASFSSFNSVSSAVIARSGRSVSMSLL